MSKFGELIDTDVPVLLCFVTTWDADSKSMNDVIKQVAMMVGYRSKIIKIDVDKNSSLSDALRIKTLPTFIIYKNKEMQWRDSGVKEEKYLFETLKHYW